MYCFKGLGLVKPLAGASQLASKWDSAALLYLGNVTSSSLRPLDLFATPGCHWIRSMRAQTTYEASSDRIWRVIPHSAQPGGCKRPT